MTITRRMFDSRGNAVPGSRHKFSDERMPELSMALHTVDVHDRFTVDRITFEHPDGARTIWTRGPELCWCSEHDDDEPCRWMRDPARLDTRVSADVCTALLRFIVSTMNVTDEHEHDRGAAPIEWATFDEILIAVHTDGDLWPTGTLVDVGIWPTHYVDAGAS